MSTNLSSEKITLAAIKPGQRVQIEYLEPSPLKERLMSMGLVPGTALKVLRSAPLGDPMAISVRSYNLSLRLADAQKIIVSTAAL
ncbi:FeoA family protein [Pectinatus brassicae]|uniref:Ferrous iron transport protein A n=1 Tax=Pectinatus brassicae TaxID=862415 RepID=A0A840UEI4_9FIRM|nr:ferrous iron transport protein A [Pectinatus brassicae]MBB5335439.1 ferrous iron transport protein A [Pectinatus brassicae]